MKCKMSHIKVGGVTRAEWYLLHATRAEELKTAQREALMTPANYRRSLQTALDDTVPCPSGLAIEVRRLEGGLEEEEVVVHEGDQVTRRPVYDAGGWAPDVGALPHGERLLWVRAQTVWRKGTGVRQLTPQELLSVWDYEGKLESKDWTSKELEWVIKSRMASPPAKLM